MFDAQIRVAQWSGSYLNTSSEGEVAILLMAARCAGL